MTRRQLTDKQWKMIEPYLPIGEYGPYPGRLRTQLEGVIWWFRAGAQWREMPDEFGPWPTVYGRFRVWRDAGVFTALLEGLIAEAAPHGKADLSLISVDSTVVRAHHDAAGRSRARSLLDGLQDPSHGEVHHASRRGGGGGAESDHRRAHHRRDCAGREGDR
ncbi:transposase, partial [Streptomyces sp. NPDC048362]|uniref:transposase n=1 Tax=Streptomyces sp. NPDC048362 TaxID=3365539 RepID=UPI003719CC35